MGVDIHEKDGTAIQEKLFAAIFNKYHQQIYRIAFSVTKSAAHSGDMVQEVFLKLWEQGGGLNEIANPEAWLHRVLRNKLIDFLRKTAADERLRSSLWKSVKETTSDSHELLAEREAAAILQNAIGELPEQRRLVYRLNRESGLSYKEIAEELSISRHTVKNHLSLALRFLQKKFSFE